MRFSVRNRLIVAEVVAAQIASGYNSVAFSAQWLNSMRAGLLGSPTFPYDIYSVLVVSSIIILGIFETHFKTLIDYHGI